MTHKIAIIKTRDFSNDYDDMSLLITSITDWCIVSHDEFIALKEMQNKLNFTVIEQPVLTTEFVANTVADYLECASQEAKRIADHKAAQAQIALDKKNKKAASDRNSKLAMFKRLKEELGPDALS